MPTKRNRRAQGSRSRVSPALLALMQLGHVPADTPGRAERFFWLRTQIEAGWRELREAVLTAWGAARPGSRPWAWWQFDAPEPRRTLSGASLLLSVGSRRSEEHTSELQSL